MSGVRRILFLSRGASSGVIERLKMSKMGNLYLEISEKLEKEYPAYKEALECDCEVCEDIKEQAIQTAFEEYSKAYGIYTGFARFYTGFIKC